MAALFTPVGSKSTIEEQKKAVRPSHGGYGVRDHDGHCQSEESPFVFWEMMKSEKVSSMVTLTTNLILP